MTKINIYDTEIEMAEGLFSLFEANVHSFREAKSEDDKAVYLGKFLEAAGQLDQAKKAYGLVNEHSSNEHALGRLAVVAFKKGEKDAGKSLVDKLLKKNSTAVFSTLSGKPISVMTVKGDYLKTEGDYERAIKTYSKALDIVEDDQHALGGMTTCLVKLGRYDQAVEVSEKLTHPTYRGIKATLDLLSNNGSANSIMAIDASAASLARVHS